jgi:hypothetical protein
MSKSRWPQTLIKEQKIIDKIQRHRARYDESPSVKDIAKTLHMSDNGARYHIKRMLAEGKLSAIVINGYTVPNSLRVIEPEDA